MNWQPIETASKEPDKATGLSQHVILGFAADEDGYTLSSREGFWNKALNRWSSSLDPGWTDSPQPTHWMPFPDPPPAEPLPTVRPDTTLLPGIPGHSHVVRDDGILLCGCVWPKEG